ncbi:MAG: DUF362 domain-containing protein [Myxococcota bacterium]
MAESGNLVFAAARDALLGLGLDFGNEGTAAWNPLSALVNKGGTVVLKPNFIRHWNPLSEDDPRASVDSVITHGSVVRAAAEYAFLAVGKKGRVIVAEAPQQDCDFEVIKELTGLRSIQEYFLETHDFELEILDLRLEKVLFRDGVIMSREPLPGDPLGYRAVDLGSQSFFTDSGLDPNLFRGADYDPGPTSEQHSSGKNAYLLSETVLSADLIINLPKLKTHKKTGVTLALKNMVGINGDKNWLPHHCAGGVEQGGDEFPGRALRDRGRSKLVELARSLLKRGRGTRLARNYRKFEIATRGDDFIRSGNWHGNQTTWRMCADLNRCVYYSDAQGTYLEAPAPVRTVLTLMDAIVAAEGNGPLAPRDVPLGVILASTDPIAVDLAAVRLMNFDPNRIAKIREVMQASILPITAVRNASDVEIGEPKQGKPARGLRVYALDDLEVEASFVPHPGWVGQIEGGQDSSMRTPMKPREVPT